MSHTYGDVNGSYVPSRNHSYSGHGVVVDSILSHHDHTIFDSIAHGSLSPQQGDVTTAFPHGDKHGSQDSTSHILAYVFVPLGALVLIAVLSFLVVFILKKSKLDKLRHHLMPLYNFDPAEEEGDWESELLEEDKEQQVALQIKSPSPTDGPKLKFSTECMEV